MAIVPFSPTNIERHARLYSGLAANALRDQQSAGMINGCFHGR